MRGKTYFSCITASGEFYLRIFRNIQKAGLELRAVLFRLAKQIGNNYPCPQVI
jgi:hypothetical protein